MVVMMETTGSGMAARDGAVRSTINDRTVALVALLQATRRRWSDIRADLDDDRDVLDLLRNEVAVDLLDDELRTVLDSARTRLEQWQSDGIRTTSPFTDDYPVQLRTVHDYPPVLFARGHFDAGDIDSVAVVGTRKPSPPALAFIDEVVPLIAADGVPIVSGLAAGVDAAAMRASLRAGNRTVGIIGTGLNRSYPAANRALQTEVARDHLLLSQFWPDAPGSKTTFPMRNHVMSAFASMTLIVEAGEFSGTRTQARAATLHARPLIITRAVEQQTQWAKDLLARELDVTVVSNAAEARDAVRAIRARYSIDSWPLTERPASTLI